MAAPDRDSNQHEQSAPGTSPDALSEQLLTAARDNVTRMGADLHQAFQVLDQVITKMQTALNTAVSLADGGSPYAHEQMVAVETVATSVQALASQAEQVSTAYTLLSSQSMAEYVSGLQKYVAAIAVARTA